MPIISTRVREKRRDRRRAINLTFQYEELEFQIADCSLGGLVIEGGCLKFPAGSDVIASLATPDGELPACQNISFKVVRNDPRNQRVGFNFVGLSDACFTALERHLTGRAKH